MTRLCRACVAFLVGAGACDDTAPPSPPGPAGLEIVTDLAGAGITGATVPFTVRVVDEGGRPVRGILVQFTSSLGAGRVAPVRDTTGDDGIASTILTLSTTPGPNQVTALAAHAGQVQSGTLVGAHGDARTISFSPRTVWFQPTVGSRVISAVARDQFGNPVPDAISWTSRDPAVVAIRTSTGGTAEVDVVGRPGGTYLVATHGAATDSVLVAVHDATSSPCDFLASPVDLAVGGSLSFESAGQACVRADSDAEYFLIAHYNTAIASASAGIGIIAHGVGTSQAGGAPAGGTSLVDASQGHPSFESALRERERTNLGPRVAGARRWYDTRARFRSLSSSLRAGDLVSVNVNAFDFCTAPTVRTARVVALTQGTMVLEDTTNPPGGFTVDEYHAVATTVDTLVLPVNIAAFGAPTDIDGNDRIAVLFTRAVNELTPRGSGGIVLGFYYSRDLLPPTSAEGECPGSNGGEIFYVMVPDPNAVTGDARTKEFVHGIAIATVAHELQHLISSSRRMYVTRAQEVNEETWLNEGLSHIAEELVFYRASGLGPRQNIGAAELAPGTRTREMHDLFMRGNFGRLVQYLDAPRSNSALAANDQLATRGAAWAFLRYVADHAGAVDGDLWRRLVDGQHVGVVNLDAALASTGMTALGALRHWTAAIALDDVVTGASPELTQPSWNFVTALPAAGYEHRLSVVPLANAQPSSLPLRSGGSIHYRLSVDAGREALVQVSSGGGVAQPGIRLTIVRTR